MDSLKLVLSSTLSIPIGLVILFFLLNSLASYLKRNPKKNVVETFVDVIGYGSTLTAAAKGFPYLSKIDSSDLKIFLFVGIGVFVISASTGFIKIVKEIFQKQLDAEENPPQS